MNKENPGKVTYGWGLLGLIAYMVGGGIATAGQAPSDAFFITGVAYFVVLTFVSSVVGAYYAGKKR